jgi:trehalose/maltose transport system permease protein
LLATGFFPVLRTVLAGLHDASSMGGPWRFTGLSHFDASALGMLADENWLHAVSVSLLFAGVSVFLETVLGLLIALLLHANRRGRLFVQIAVLVPWVLPTVVATRMWHWMLNDQFGIVNSALIGLGLLSTPVAWMAYPETAIASIIVIDVWKTTPFMVLILLAGLRFIPHEYQDAARVDGAGAWRVFRDITLPLLKPALLVAVIFRTVEALGAFDIFYVLASGSTRTMSMSVYVQTQLIANQDLGYASALATAMFAIVALATVIFVYKLQSTITQARS